MQLKDYLLKQNRRIRNYSFIDGRTSRQGRKINQQKVLEQTQFNRQFNVPPIAQIFKYQDTQKLRFQNKMIRSKLEKNIKSLEQRKNYFLQQKIRKKRNTVFNQDYQDPRDKWVKNIISNIQTDRKKMVQQIQHIDLYQLPLLIQQSPKITPTKLHSLNKPRHSFNTVERSNLPLIKVKMDKKINKFKAVSSSKIKQMDSLVNTYDSNLVQNIIDKRIAYGEQRLSPARLRLVRQHMGKRLNDRLQLIKQQSQRFYEAMIELKNKQLILPLSILQFLEKIRQLLLSGKVLKLQQTKQLLGNVQASLQLSATLQCIQKVTVQ